MALGASKASGRPCRSLLSLLSGVVSVLLTAGQLGAEGFVCAGYPAAEPDLLSEGAAAKAAALPVVGRLSSQGRVHALVIFAQFKDEAPDDLSVPDYAADLFDPDLPGSLTHFYHTMSFGQFTLEGTVLPKRYTSDQPAAAYLPPEPGKSGEYGQFAREILRQVDQDADFARFDNDGPDGLPDSGDDDGVVDYVFLCVRSTPYGFLLGAATGIATLGFAWYETRDAGFDGEPVGISGRRSLDGTTTSRGAIGREGSLAQTVGALAHEFGHSLGLPDLYDLDYRGPADDSAGIGRWGLMGWGADGWNGNDGPNPFCAWSREQLGWISTDNGRLVEVAEETAGLVLADLQAGGPAVKIPLRAESADGAFFEQDYLLLEHRTRTGTFYNRSLPAEGLLVWRIRPQITMAHPQPVNSDEHDKGVDLVCADGLYRDAGYPLGQAADPEQGSDNLDFWSHDAAHRGAHGGNMGDATDPFDGVRFTRLDPRTNPASEPPRLLFSASTALSLSLSLQEEAMVLDVMPTRWVGEIFEVPGHEMHERSVLVSSDQAALIRVPVWAKVDAADLVVRSFPQGALLAEIPMVRHAGAGEGQVFEASFEPPAATLYRLFVRLRDAAGAVVLSKTCLRLWATAPEEPRPVLVFPGDLYAAEARNTLRQMLEEALAELRSSARVLLVAPEEGTFYLPFLELQGAKGTLVIWLGETMDPDELATYRTFLERGGRLLLISRFFGLRPDLGTFLGEMLYSRSTGSHSSKLRSLYLSEPLLFQVRHAQLALRLPAEPVLLNNFHQAAGLRLDTGTYRAVYLPFDLRGLGEDVRRGLIASSLRFLQQQVAQGAVLELGMDEQVGPVLGLPADGLTVVRARIQGAVQAADLMVRSFPQRQALAVLPMRRVLDTGSAHLFEVALEPPGQGQYHLSVRLHSAAGDTLFVGTGQRVLGLFKDRPALLLLSEPYTLKADEIVQELLGQFEEGLRQEGLAASVVRAVNEEGAIYENLLGRYLDGVKLVVWLGQTLDERGQAAFRAFLERGGRLLLISPEFHTSPGSGTFLEAMLNTRSHPISGRRYLRSTRQLREPIEFRIQPGSLLELTAPAVPLLLDEAQRVAGIGVDNGRYRAVYLPFDLYGVEGAARRPLIESSLAFLVQGGSPEPLLQLAAVIAPPLTTELQPLAPHVAVANWGPRDSEEFRVGYQILLGEEVLVAAAREEAPLAALAEREIALPVWEPGGEGAFHIRFGLGAPGQEDLVYAPARRLYVAEVGEAFAEVALPGEVSEGHGAGFFDYDNDGDLDLYLVRRGEANQLFRNEGAGFTQQAKAAGVAHPGEGRGLAVGDYDGDGDLDLYLVNGGWREDWRFCPNRLFRNEGDDTFVDVTLELDADPLTTTPLGDGAPGRSAGFFDCDLDGDLDLYLVNALGLNRLYRNQEGGFSEDAAAAGLADAGDGRGLAVSDYDGDGDVDLFVANISGGSRLFRNDGGTFAEVHRKMGLVLVGDGNAGVFGDYDNDGGPDLYVSTVGGPSQLFRNERGLSFEEVTPGEGLSLGAQTLGAAFFDHDNDGDLDLATTASASWTTWDELYHNQGGYMVPVGPLLALRSGSKGRGVSFGDYDQDGDVDWFVADVKHSRLYRNQADQNHWLQVDLAGIEPNPDGMGARLELATRTGRQYREVQSTYGYCSQTQPWVHFGLGDAAEVDTLRVRWPDGQETVETDVAANQHLVVKHPSLITAVLDEQEALPTTFELWPNYPNPFNPSTIIQFAVPAMPGGSHPLVTIAIYDLLGQGVRTVVSAEFGPGVYRTAWDGRDDHGRGLASGAYLYRMRAGDHTQARKLLLIR